MRVSGIWLGLWLALFAAPVQSAQDEDSVHRFEPSGPWNMEYADDSCRLIRNFTDGQSTLTLAFERLGLGAGMRLGLTGNALKAFHKASKAGFRYEPGGPGRSGEMLRSILADGREAYLIDSATLVDFEQWAEDAKVSFLEVEREELAAAADITAISLTEGFTSDFTVDLGPMAAPVQALQACATDLVESWGIDPKKMDSMLSGPKPANSLSSWIDIRKYPTEMLRLGKSGVVRMRLVVDVQGRVEACRFEVEEPGVFENTACDQIKRNARFTPALDADGKPMRAYWWQAVRFIP